jgi:hypothetical protein
MTSVKRQYYKATSPKPQPPPYDRILVKVHHDARHSHNV